MEQYIAADLIRKGIAGINVQRWADLGAGEGVFTVALASLLQPGSSVFAIDKSKRALDLLTLKPETSIRKIVGDFSDEQVIPSALDGILLANSMHYIQDKRFLLGMLAKKLKQGGRIIVVEYDLERPNPWVPFPLSIKLFSELAASAGLSAPKEIGRVPSRLNASEIYSAIVLK